MPAGDRTRKIIMLIEVEDEALNDDDETVGEFFFNDVLSSSNHFEYGEWLRSIEGFDTYRPGLRTSLDG